MEPAKPRSVISPAFDGQRSLAGGGQHDVGFEELADGVQPVHALQPGGGQHHGVKIAGFARDNIIGHVSRQTRDTAEARVHVPADIEYLNVRTCSPKLSGTPGRACPDFGTTRQLSECHTVACTENIADIHPLGCCGDAQAKCCSCWQVLKGVHGNITALSEKGIPKGRDEHTCTAHLGQRPGLDVALGLDMYELHRETANRSQLVRGLLRLRQGKFAGPGTDAYRHLAASGAG